MIKHKSTLAKLMARENITVQYGNYQTAWFDIKNRVLGLPMWKDMGKDVSDLLIGHEVGHALFTPFEGWHDSPEKLEGCPRSYINVVEDARIERHIKEAYVGLVGPMQRGYRKLFDDGFFGDTQSLEWDAVKLIDKINLQAKVGNLLDVPFSDEEQVYMDRAMKTVTFEDVTNLVRDILDYTKENQPELLNPPAQPEQSESDFNEEDEKDEQQPQMGHDDMQSSEDEEDAQAESNQKSNQSQQPTEDKEVEEDKDAESKGNVEEDISETDEMFRRKEHTLLDTDEYGNQVLIGNDFNKEVAKRIVIPYAQLAKERKAKIAENYEYLNNVVKIDPTDYWYDKREQPLTYDETLANYKSYIKEVKKNVNFAVKEFEMRKAGYRYTRAQTAKTGSIDVNRLWSYKTNDDIFARVTKLADAKNHGMFMLIDFSGSMNDIMGDVLEQLIHCIVFCKTVNIPFDVYGFTNQNVSLGGGWDGDRNVFPIDSEVDHGGLSLPQLITSTLKRKDYEEALQSLYVRMEFCKDDYTYRERLVISKNEEYGSTPLNEALIHSHKMIDGFKRANNVDNMNLVVISDGDANGLRIAKDRDMKIERTISDRWRGAVINIMGKNVKLKDTRREGTKSLLENLQKQFGLTTIGFFLADNGHNFKYKISDCDTEADMWDNGMKKYNREYAKNKCVTFKNELGYNELYIVKSWKGALATDATEFEVNEDASKGQLTSAFKKYSKSKKLNKTLLTNFGKAVAE